MRLKKKFIRKRIEEQLFISSINISSVSNGRNFFNQALKVKIECALRSECFCHQRKCKSLSDSFGTFSPFGTGARL
ncbi:hypothetical protein CEXT_103611 [Caerostris extrusa]|uniref:Uncharacterized protein n=1 Tax=Caerostris extrusa TaxID=172846 RepID=A0AAV4TUG6_CAEEX|nr:hypothetical protein CEXT_103611 [Caerostris extrusa]